MEELDILELEDYGGDSGFLFEVEGGPDECELFKVVLDSHYIKMIRQKELF